MKYINFDCENQDFREEWLQWRKKGIGGSDIGVIMGSNPYKTPVQLWEEKCGYRGEEFVNAAMKHGIASEPLARDWLNAQEGMHLIPCYVEDDENPYFRASLDGFDSQKRVLCEIKSPISEATIQNARLNNAIPDHWWQQIQWNMMITKAARTIFAIWDYKNHNCIVIEMYPHEKLWAEMRQKASLFWRNVQMGKTPELTSRDFISLEDDELKGWLEEYNTYSKEIKDLEKKKKVLSEKIIGKADDKNVKSYGFSIQKMSGRTTFDMEQMKLDGVDIEAYSKIGAPYYRISASKEKS